MNNIKADEIENYIVENYGTMKHDKHAFADAINEVSGDIETVNPWDICLLYTSPSPRDED